MYTDFEKNFTINMETAARIGFSPKFSVLSRALLINENYIATDREVDLVDVMKEALETNLDLDFSKTDVMAAGHDLSMAKTGYYPSLAADFDGVVIDEKRAGQSNGALAQTTTTGSISANQLIYSDQVLGNIKAQKGLVQASEFGFQNTKLSVVLEAIDGYFKILMAQTTRNIYGENLDLIKQNLKIAEQREIIGYSGRSDVLRWKSQQASASTDLLAARQEVILAKNELKRVLNRNQGEAFLVKDTSLDSRIFSTYAVNAVEKYIDNQNSLDRFTRFFVEQSIENSVEIKGLDENRSALQVSLNSLKRKNYLPTINFSASHDHVF
ncbi:MAG: TolC family protein, partial [Desulfobacteraceae bacterium]|nr:TolC family protein [Desulfobacteraceae bacterium]